jgi:hypothetical protein
VLHFADQPEIAMPQMSLNALALSFAGSSLKGGVSAE